MAANRQAVRGCAFLGLLPKLKKLYFGNESSNPDNAGAADWTVVALTLQLPAFEAMCVSRGSVR